MHTSILLSATVLIVSNVGTLASPLDREAGTIDPALLSIQPGSDQQSSSSQQTGVQAGNSDYIRKAEDNGRNQANAWLFAQSIDELEVMLDKYMKHHDGRMQKWQRTVSSRRVKDEWTCTDTTRSPGNFNGFEESLSHLRIDPPAGLTLRPLDIPQPSTSMYPDGPWVRMKAVQNKPYKAFRDAHWEPDVVRTRLNSVTTRTPFEATEMAYENAYNIVDGILILQSVRKPQHGIDRTDLQLPQPHTWGELSMHIWKELRKGVDAQGAYGTFCKIEVGDQGQPKHNPLAKFRPYGDESQILRIEHKSTMFHYPHHLNYIIVPDVSPTTQINKALHLIIKDCLLSRDVRQIPTMENRESFGVGHWCFYALLGAGNERIALMLAQHRDPSALYLGHKFIQSISIFKPAEKQFPSLLFSIADWSDAATVAKDLTETVWRSAVASGGKYKPVSKECDSALHL